jgi:hypothetical protein
MARAYTLGTAALALSASAKWLDNALSHFRVVGVQQARQGIARRLTIESLLTLSVAIALVDQLQIPLGRAIEISEQLNRTGGDGSLALSDTLDISVDLTTLRTQLLERLEHAVEIAPIPRRGRPPKNTTGRLE